MASWVENYFVLWIPNKFRRTPSDPVPPEPYGIVLCWKQIRAYTPKGSTRLRLTVKPEITYFNLKKSCVQNDSSKKLGLTASLSLRMTSAILSKSISTNQNKNVELKFHMSKKMFGLFIQLALNSVLFFVQKQGKFTVYFLSDVHQVPQSFLTEPLHLLKVELEY